MLKATLTPDLITKGFIYIGSHPHEIKALTNVSHKYGTFHGEYYPSKMGRCESSFNAQRVCDFINSTEHPHKVVSLNLLPMNLLTAVQMFCKVFNVHPNNIHSAMKESGSGTTLILNLPITDDLTAGNKDIFVNLNTLEWKVIS